MHGSSRDLGIAPCLLPGNYKTDLDFHFQIRWSNRNFIYSSTWNTQKQKNKHNIKRMIFEAPNNNQKAMVPT